MAKKKQKGRPPKFVLDENGKDVYGLSYNKSTNMYYATFSDPRIYFSARGKSQERKQNAIAKYGKWTENQKLSPEQQQEKAELDRAYDKARELLLKDEYIQEEITRKAKQLLEEAEQDNSREEYGRFTELVSREAESLIDNGEFDDYFVSQLDELCWRYNLTEKIGAEIKRLLDKGRLENFRKYLWEMIHNELIRTPIKIAKATKIPQLAFVKTQVKENLWSCVMPWSMAWEIFYEYKPKDEYRFDRAWYLIIEKKWSYHLGEKLLRNIDYESLQEALTFNIRNTASPIFNNVFGEQRGQEHAKSLMDQYRDIPVGDRLELIEEVFTTINKAGYPHANHIFQELRLLYKDLCS